ncbi:hypothetical protein FACS1894201_11220 [Bacteroidia bacterium]|nr:hypothetical protein FACS1894201_11220 [Bacteroidia bacterium]
MKPIHIGEIIQQKVKERKLSVVDFAKAIGHSRDYVYTIYNNQSIDIELLMRISEVLHYDFLSELYCKQAYSKKHLVLLEVNEQQRQKLLESFSHEIVYIYV